VLFQVLRAESIEIFLAEVGGDGFDFLLIHPDVARSARAAAAALRALESKSFRVPGFAHVISLLTPNGADSPKVSIYVNDAS
jgi:hypothetical protein